MRAADGSGAAAKPVASAVGQVVNWSLSLWVIVVRPITRAVEWPALGQGDRYWDTEMD